ncbi:MAG: hypothetical protein AB7V18_01155 [Pyrinomonadaceae bacterium]
MTLLEALIIYLSVGAPFGVLVYFSSRGSTAARILYLTSVATFLWPIFAAGRLRRAFRSDFGKPRLSDSAIRPEPLSLHSIPGVLGHRRISAALERHIGIAEGVPSDRGRNTTGIELLRVAGHSDPELGARCLLRERSRRLKDHQSRSAISLLEEMSLGRPSKEIMFKVAEVCSALGDPETADSIHALIDSSHIAETAKAEARAGSPVVL